MQAKKAPDTIKTSSGIELKPYYTAADVPEEHREKMDIAPGPGALPTRLSPRRLSQQALAHFPAQWLR